MRKPTPKPQSASLPSGPIPAPLLTFGHPTRPPQRHRMELPAVSRGAMRQGEPLRLREAAVRAREIACDLREQQLNATAKALNPLQDRINMMREANAEMVQSALKANALAEDERVHKEALKHLAQHDTLTGLGNRALLYEQLTQSMSVARSQGSQLAVMFIDLDHFKAINDTLGHAVGDELLKAVAQRLCAGVRHSDFISRLGGDEFVAVLTRIEHIDDARHSAQKILDSLIENYSIEGRDLVITASIGISLFPSDSADAAGLIECADSALYLAKGAGRNRFAFFDPDRNVPTPMRQSLESALRRAIDAEELALQYQPIFDLKTTSICRIEALIRWLRPGTGLSMPPDFLPMAERSGLIMAIGRWVLRTALHEARTWETNGLPAPTLAINLSALEFRAPDFMGTLRSILKQSNFEPQRLSLELNAEVIESIDRADSPLLHQIQELGIQLALNDFGTGSLSLQHLQELPIQSVKIDRSLISHPSNRFADSQLLRSAIHLAQELDRRVVAVGIETPAQLKRLQDYGCDEGQGYWLGRPVAAQAIAQRLRPPG